VIFLFTKFTAGAWVVVVAVPLFMLLFSRVSAYYQRVGPELGLGRHPPKPKSQPVVVVVPVTGVSRLSAKAVSVALSISKQRGSSERGTRRA
jgi:hypothetical protein